MIKLINLLIFGAWGMPGSFMFHSPTARAFSLGSAFTAFSEDPSAIYFNPAGIAELNPQEIQFSNSPLPLGGQYGWLGYVRPTLNIGNFGAALLFLNSGKINLTDPQAQSGGDFNHFETAFYFTYAREFSKYFDAGISYKILFKSVSRYSSIAHSFDLGFLLFPQNVYRFGLSFINLLSTPYKLIEESEKFPLAVRAGLASVLFEGKLNLFLDFWTITGWNENFYSFGLEYYPIDIFSLRIGFSKYNFSAGSGVFLKLPGKRIGIDFGGAYQFESQGLFPLTGFVTLWFKFAGFRVEVTPNVRVFSPRSRENNILKIDLFTQARKDIEKWQFIVKDSKGEIKRIYKDFGVPPRELLWDGRDDLGMLVQDGSYYYEFRVVQKDGSVLMDNGFLAEIRTIGPKGEIFFKERSKKQEEIK